MINAVMCGELAQVEKKLRQKGRRGYWSWGDSLSLSLRWWWTTLLEAPFSVSGFFSLTWRESESAGDNRKKYLSYSVRVQYSTVRLICMYCLYFGLPLFCHFLQLSSWLIICGSFLQRNLMGLMSLRGFYVLLCVLYLPTLLSKTHFLRVSTQ